MRLKELSRLGFTFVAAFATTLSTISCGVTSTGSAPQDPQNPNILYASAPRFLCAGEKKSFQLSVKVDVPSGFSETHYVWYEMIRSSDQIPVECDWRQFDTSRIIVFNDIEPALGSYRVRTGLSQYAGCDFYTYKYLSYELYVSVDSGQCTYREFPFDVYQQAFYDPMPYGVTMVQFSYDPVKITLNPTVVSASLPAETLYFFDSDLMQYLFANKDQSTGMSDHLFGICGFKGLFGQTFLPHIYGYALSEIPYVDRAVFVCGGAISAQFSAQNYHNAVSSTTGHEFGHLIGGLSDACVRPDSHVAGVCMMSDIGQVPPDSLVLLCNYQPPVQTWPFSTRFCDSCYKALTSLSW